MTAATVYGITLAQVDELIEQAEKLVAICELLLNDGGGDLHINRNSFGALLGDPVYKVRDIAASARRVEAQVMLQ